MRTRTEIYHGEVVLVVAHWEEKPGTNTRPREMDREVGGKIRFWCIEIGRKPIVLPPF